MDNKYYTPEIEEFHVGFEYEYQSYNKISWTNYIVTEEDLTSSQMDLCASNGIEDVFDKLKTNGVRVKYLDKSDIESCGFSLQGVPRYNDVSDIVEGYGLYINDTDDLYLHLIEGNRYAIYLSHEYNEFSGNWEQVDLFNGIIKNLSELRKLLKQLGI